MVSLRGLTLTAARPRIIVPLFARDPAALCPLAKAASADPAAELVELRLDPLPADEFLNALALVRGIVDKPLVVTIRTRAEGGELALTPDAYAAHCRALLARGGVDVLDIEWRACGAFRAELRDAAHAAGAAALFSEHHFDAIEVFILHYANSMSMAQKYKYFFNKRRISHKNHKIYSK